jgi:hypothetical protein
VAESAHRLIGAFGRNYGGFGGAQLPKWLFYLRKAAQRRGIWLQFLPRGMARREQNRSRHNHRYHFLLFPYFILTYDAIRWIFANALKFIYK